MGWGHDQPDSTEATMIRAKNTFGSFAVSDLDAAKKFYADTLGLKVEAVDAAGGAVYLRGPGDQTVLVYPKPDHAAASFTVLNVEVENLEEAVDDLAARGVTFERYEGMEADDRGIVREEGVSAAWLTDPAGNVVAILQLDT